MVSLTNWFLQTLQLLLLLMQQCHSMGNECVSVWPGDLDAVTGRWNVNFTCMVKPCMQDRYNASDLNFTYEFMSTYPKPVPLAYVKIIDTWTIEVRHFPEIDEAKGYKRRNVNCGIKNIGDSMKPVEVQVGKRHEIPRIKIIAVDNWETLTFTWETMENLELMHAMDYKAWYWSSSNYSQRFQCKYLSNSLCNVTNPFQVASPDDVLIVKVNGSSATKNSHGILEEVTSQEVTVNLTEYLRPRKIDHINITQKHSTKILIFKPPKTNQNIRYDINVNCTKQNIIQTRIITRRVSDFNYKATNSEENSKEMLVTEPLVGLPPYANCTVSIRSISVNGGKWSEWKHHDFQTLQDVPLAVPQSCRCCFQVMMETDMESLFHVIVYFTPLLEEEARGEVELYRINMIENGVLHNNATELTRDPLYLSSFLLNNLSNKIDYKISIEVKTQIGYNETLDLSPSTILVPQSKLRPKSLSHKFIVVILNETSIRATLEMKERSGISKMFLFWCEGSVERERPCQDVLKLKEFPIASTESVIDKTYIIHLEKPHHYFILGSGIEDNGKSSGITWSSCTYDIRSSPPKPIIESHNKTSSDVFISLHEPSCQKISQERGFVIGYRLFFCPLLQSSNSANERRCVDDEMRSLEFYGQPQILNLDELSPNKTYWILISSLSETKTSSNVTLVVTTLPTEALFVWPIIVSVVIFILVAIFLVIACVPVKGKPLWKYLKDYRTVGEIVIPPASRFVRIESGRRAAEDEGYKFPNGTANDAIVVAAALQSADSAALQSADSAALQSADSADSSASKPLLDVSTAENNSNRIAVLIGIQVPHACNGPDTADDPGACNDLVAVDAPGAFNDLVAVDAPAAFNDPVAVDVPDAFNDLVTVDAPVAFNDTATSAISVVSGDPGTADVPIAVDGPNNAVVPVDPSPINISVVPELANGANVPASANAEVFLILSSGLGMSSLRRTGSSTSVENNDNNSARILPSLFTDLTKVSEDHHTSISGVIKDNADEEETHPIQLQQQHHETETKTLLHVSLSVCDSFDEYYTANVADHSTRDETLSEKLPSNEDEGYVDGSQRVCSVFLPVPSSEPAQPVMYDSGGYSDCNRIGSETEDAASSSMQTESYDSSARRIGDTSSDAGYRGVKITSSSRSDDSENRNDSDYPPMRIIDVDFYDDDDVNGKLEKVSHVTDDVAIPATDVIRISDEVVLSTDSNISDVIITVPTGDVISADVIASSDVMTVIPNDLIAKRTTVDCNGELQWVSGENDPDGFVDEDCIYSTVVDVNAPCRTVHGLHEPIPPPVNSEEVAGDDGYYSGGLVSGSLSSSPRTPGFEGLEVGGGWTLRDEHQRHLADWSANPVSLSRSSSVLPWSLNLQTAAGLEPFPERVLPSILPSCV